MKYWWKSYWHFVFKYFIIYYQKYSLSKWLTEISRYELVNPFTLRAAKRGLTILKIFQLQKHFLENIRRRNVDKKPNNESPSNILWTFALFTNYFQKYERSRQHHLQKLLSVNGLTHLCSRVPPEPVVWIYGTFVDNLYFNDYFTNIWWRVSSFQINISPSNLVPNMLCNAYKLSPTFLCRQCYIKTASTILYTWSYFSSSRKLECCTIREGALAGNIIH